MLIQFSLFIVSATEYHLGLLKAKLAKYRSQLLEPSKKSGEKGEGFDVLKSGDARVALIGFPSVGKVNYLLILLITFSSILKYFFLCSLHCFQHWQRLKVKLHPMSLPLWHVFLELSSTKEPTSNFLIFLVLLKEPPRVKAEESRYSSI